MRNFNTSRYLLMLLEITVLPPDNAYIHFALQKDGAIFAQVSSRVTIYTPYWDVLGSVHRCLTQQPLTFWLATNLQCWEKGDWRNASSCLHHTDDIILVQAKLLDWDSKMVGLDLHPHFPFQSPLSGLLGYTQTYPQQIHKPSVVICSCTPEQHHHLSLWCHW